MASLHTSHLAPRRALLGLAGGLALSLGALPAAGAPPVFAPASPLGGHAAGDTRSDAPPAVAAAPNGTVVAVWDSNDFMGGPYGVDRDVFFARSADGGLTWSPLAPLDPLATSDTSTDVEPAVATDGQGTWVAVWRSNRGTGGSPGDLDLLFARSLDDGLTWSSPALLSTAFASDFRQDSQPAIAADGQGGWVVAWRSVGPESDVFFARSGDGGATWSTPAPLVPATPANNGVDLAPALASDGQGGWIVVWVSSVALGGSLGPDADVLFSVSSDGGLSWTQPRALNTNASGDTGLDTAPAVAADGAGGWLAVWQSTDSLGGTIGVDPDILAARSLDGGVTWSAPAPVHAHAAGDSAHDLAPTLSCSAPRRCVVAWSTTETFGVLGSDPDVVLAASEDGGASWGSPAALDPRATLDGGIDAEPALANDHRGGWVAVWQSDDSFGGTIGSDHDPLFAVGFEPAVCGDALLHRDEQCEDGNLAPGDGCRADCTIELCGDAILDPTEDCDDGNGEDGDGCRADCTIELCGDAILDPAEDCDDGNGEDGDGCRADCSAELCGDGILDPGETCDDGNASPGDGCDASCQAEAPQVPGPQSIVERFDAAVADGTLFGTGRKHEARAHLQLLRWWLVVATEWIEEGRNPAVSCTLLELALERLDGRARPPDYAYGPAAPELAALLETTLEELGCRSCRHAHGHAHGHGHGGKHKDKGEHKDKNQDKEKHKHKDKDKRKHH